MRVSSEGVPKQFLVERGAKFGRGPNTHLHTVKFQRNTGTRKRTNELAKWPLTQAKFDVAHSIFMAHSIFVRLNNQEFLDKCKQESTQNANSAFNVLVWSLPSKQKYNVLMEVSLEINITASLCNSGME